MDANEFNEAPITPVAEALFGSNWSTRTLAYQLADAISAKAGNAERMAFVAEFETGTSLWCRGAICKGLAAKGRDLSAVNWVKS